MKRTHREVVTVPVAECRFGCLPRLAVLAGAGAMSVSALAGCATYGNAESYSGATPASGSPLAKTTDIPVGGGKILTDAKLVITQPTAGTFKAFSGVCTHQGCLVTRIDSGIIICPCHGSQFTLDGEVAQGPATAPLRTEPITVSGENILLA